jgi:hypothetical protein
VRGGRGLNRRLGVAKGLGFGTESERSPERLHPASRVHPGRSGGDDKWGPAVSGGREKRRLPIRAWSHAGPRAPSRAGAKWFLAALQLFFYFFSVFFIN